MVPFLLLIPFLPQFCLLKTSYRFLFHSYLFHPPLKLSIPLNPLLLLPLLLLLFFLLPELLSMNLHGGLNDGIIIRRFFCLALLPLNSLLGFFDFLRLLNGSFALCQGGPCSLLIAILPHLLAIYSIHHVWDHIGAIPLEVLIIISPHLRTPRHPFKIPPFQPPRKARKLGPIEMTR